MQNYSFVEQEYNHFKNNLKKIYDINKKNVILDFRNNIGGLRKYPYELLESIFLNDNKTEHQLFMQAVENAESGRKTLESFLVQKNILDYYQSFYLLNEDNKKIDEIESELIKLEKNQTKKISEFKSKTSNTLLNGRNNSTLYILLNNKTASSAEMAIFLALALFPNKIVLIGENSSGSVNFGGYYDYVLPNSKFVIRLSSVDFRNCNFIKNNKKYFGETKGFEPDYWTNENNFVETLIYLTGDSKIENLFN